MNETKVFRNKISIYRTSTRPSLIGPEIIAELVPHLENNTLIRSKLGSVLLIDEYFIQCPDIGAYKDMLVEYAFNSIKHGNSIGLDCIQISGVLNLSLLLFNNIAGISLPTGISDDWPKLFQKCCLEAIEMNETFAGLKSWQLREILKYLYRYKLITDLG